MPVAEPEIDPREAPPGFPDPLRPHREPDRFEPERIPTPWKPPRLPQAPPRPSDPTRN